MGKYTGGNIFKAGEIVCAKVNPTLNLVIRRYIDRIYYCRIQEEPGKKELVYFERELKPAAPKPK